MKNAGPSLLPILTSGSTYGVEYKPRAVVTSALFDAESQLPAEAANHLSIPTFAIPHAGAMIAEKTISSRYILYSCKTQKSAFEYKDIEANRLFACRDTVAKNDYKTRSIATTSKNNGWRVLALRNPCGPDGCLLPSTNIRYHLNALHVLANPPADIAEQLSLHIKVHPNYPDSELYDFPEIELSQHVLPADSELHEVLQQTDLVVSVNYAGSALIHVLKSGKPIIFLRTMWQQEPDLELFLPAGRTVRTHNQFWSSIKDFFTKPEDAAQMVSNARNFCSNYLDDSGYPDIGEIVEQKLRKTVD